MKRSFIIKNLLLLFLLTFVLQNVSAGNKSFFLKVNDNYVDAKTIYIGSSGENFTIDIYFNSTPANDKSTGISIAMLYDSNYLKTDASTDYNESVGGDYMNSESYVGRTYSQTDYIPDNYDDDSNSNTDRIVQLSYLTGGGEGNIWPENLDTSYCTGSLNDALATSESLCTAFSGTWVSQVLNTSAGVPIHLGSLLFSKNDTTTIAENTQTIINIQPYAVRAIGETGDSNFTNATITIIFGTAPPPASLISVTNNQTGLQRGIGDFVYFNVSFNDNVTIKGNNNPELSLNIDTLTRTAQYFSGNKTKNLIFRYQLNSNDNGLISIPNNPLTIGSLLQSGDGTIVSDYPGNNALSLISDNSIETIYAIYTNITNHVKIGDKIYLFTNYTDLTYSDDVFEIVSGGLNPNLSFSIGGGVLRYASYLKIIGNSVIYDYEIAEGDNGPVSLSTGNVVTLGGLVKKYANNEEKAPSSQNNNNIFTSSFYVYGLRESIVSILRGTTNRTIINGETGSELVNFTLSFSGSVFNVDVSDFLVGTDFLTGTTVSQVYETTDSSYNVEVNTGAGNGLVWLELSSSPSITGTYGNNINTQLPSGVNNQSFSIIKTSPNLIYLNRTQSTQRTNVDEVNFTITFDSKVDNTTIVGNTGNFQFSDDSLGVISNIVWVSLKTYIITVSNIVSSGVLGLELKTVNSIANLLGLSPATFTITGQTYTIDQTPPTISLVFLDLLGEFTNVLMLRITGLPSGDLNTAKVKAVAFLTDDPSQRLMNNSLKVNSSNGVTFDFSGTFNSDGNVSVNLTLEDDLGNTRTKTFENLTYQDTTAPTLTVNPQNIGTIDGKHSAINVSLTATDETGFNILEYNYTTPSSVSCNSNSAIYINSKTINENVIYADDSDNNKNVCFGVFDGAGNFGFETFTIQNLDSTGPIIRAGVAYNDTTTVRLYTDENLNESYVLTGKGGFSVITNDSTVFYEVTSIAIGGPNYISLTLNDTLDDNTPLTFNVTYTETGTQQITDVFGNKLQNNVGEVFYLPEGALLEPEVRIKEVDINLDGNYYLNSSQISLVIVEGETSPNINGGVGVNVNINGDGRSDVNYDLNVNEQGEYETLTGSLGITTDLSGFNDGRINITVTVSDTNNAGRATATKKIFFIKDTVKPTVSAERLNPLTVNTTLNQVVFKIIFTDNNLDHGTVSVDDFDITGSLGAISGNLERILGTDNYNLTIDVNGDGGTVSLLFETGEEVKDLANNVLDSSGFGSTYYVDTVGPTITGIVKLDQPDNNLAYNSRTMNYEITFSEDLNISSINNDSFTITAVPISNIDETIFAELRTVTGGPRIWNIEVGIGLVDGNITLGLDSGQTITDVLGNSLSGGLGTENLTYYNVNNLNPTVVEIRRNTPTGQYFNQDNVIFNIVFSKNVEDSTVQAEDFNITNGVGRIVSVDRVSGTNYTVSVNGINVDGVVRLELIGEIIEEGGTLGVTIEALTGTQYETYIIDRVDPTITLTPNSALITMTRTIIAVTSDDVSGVIYRGYYTRDDENCANKDSGLYREYSGDNYPYSFSSESDNGKFYCVLAEDKAGNIHINKTQILGIDRTSPKILSIRTLNASTNNLNNVYFEIEFDDFMDSTTVTNSRIRTSIANNNNQQVTSVTNISERKYLVKVTIPSLSEGFVNITSLSNEITDLAGNSLNTTLPVMNENYYVDAKKPTIISIKTTTGQDNVKSKAPEFIVTFSEIVYEVDLTDFKQASSSAFNGVTSFTVNASSGTVFSVIVNVGSGNGTFELDLNTNTGIRDIENNDLDATLPLGTNNYQNYDVDTQSPSIVSINRTNPTTVDPGQVNTVTYRVIFNEPLNSSTVVIEDFIPILSSITPSVDGGDLIIANVTDLISSGTTDYIVEVTISNNGRATLRLDFTGVVTDLAGNIYNTEFTNGQTYSIDRDTVKLIMINSLNQTPSNSDEVIYSVIFNKDVDDSTLNANDDFQAISINGNLVFGTLTDVRINERLYLIKIPITSGSGEFNLGYTSGADILSGTKTLDTTIPQHQSYVVDKVAPTLNSIMPVNKTGTTNQQILIFEARFSENVKNVNITDFELKTGTGYIVGGTIEDVVSTINESIWAIRVNGDIGDGKLGIQLISSPTINDVVSNSLTDTTIAINTDYTIDTVRPTVSGSVLNPTTKTNTLFSITLTFDEKVSNVDIFDFQTEGGDLVSDDNITSNDNITYQLIVFPAPNYDGNFTLNFRNNNDIIDLAGNRLNTTSYITIIKAIDTRPPPAPIILGLDSSTDAGEVGDDITNTGTVMLNGTGEAGTTVNVYRLNDLTVSIGSAVVGQDNNWNVSVTGSNGVEKVIARLTDATSNEGKISNIYRFIVDSDDAKFLNASQSGLEIREFRIYLTKPLINLSSITLTDFSIGNNVNNPTVIYVELRGSVILIILDNNLTSSSTVSYNGISIKTLSGAGITSFTDKKIFNEIINSIVHEEENPGNAKDYESRDEVVVRDEKQDIITNDDLLEIRGIINETISELENDDEVVIGRGRVNLIGDNNNGVTLDAPLILIPEEERTTGSDEAKTVIIIPKSTRINTGNTIREIAVDNLVTDNININETNNRSTSTQIIIEDRNYLKEIEIEFIAGGEVLDEVTLSNYATVCVSAEGLGNDVNSLYVYYLKNQEIYELDSRIRNKVFKDTTIPTDGVNDLFCFETNHFTNYRVGLQSQNVTDINPGGNGGSLGGTISRIVGDFILRIVPGKETTPTDSNETDTVTPPVDPVTTPKDSNETDIVIPPVGPVIPETKEEKGFLNIISDNILWIIILILILLGIYYGYKTATRKQNF